MACMARGRGRACPFPLRAYPLMAPFGRVRRRSVRFGGSPQRSAASRRPGPRVRHSSQLAMARFSRFQPMPLMKAAR